MRQVVGGELAGAQVTLEHQVFAVFHVVVDGRACQPDALRDLIDRGCGDAARVELARRLVEQQLTLRRPGRRARQLGACRARAPAAGRRLAPVLLLARFGHFALRVV
jgi:hypothetical protein